MTKREKYQALIDACVSHMDDEDKRIYRPIVEYALELGYTPKPIQKSQKTAKNENGDELAFSKSRVSRTLLRLHPGFTKPPVNYQIHQEGKAQLRLVFFATPEYSEPFRFGLKNKNEAFNFKYTGCYGCGRCKGDEGYTYTYPDGKMVFRCGIELIELPPLAPEHVEEVKAMMKAQDEFWMNKERAKND